ncbi:MAG: hypothetical protein CL663_07985 [Bacteroidetes bacterium]|nr:hypothetical protein [Bacteroidota bacterium]|tara:strand:- start:618 stop:899 length:282 start_codon:yes stop_codon:yes gene_type:complete
MVMDFKKDSHVFGAVIGLFLPVITFLAFHFLSKLIILIVDVDLSVYSFAIKLLSIAMNLIPMRYYFVNLKMDLTGRGILLVTTIYFLVYFWIN